MKSQKTNLVAGVPLFFFSWLFLLRQNIDRCIVPESIHGHPTFFSSIYQSFFSVQLFGSMFLVLQGVLTCGEEKKTNMKTFNFLQPLTTSCQGQSPSTSHPVITSKRITCCAATGVTKDTSSFEEKSTIRCHSATLQPRNALHQCVVCS